MSTRKLRRSQRSPDELPGILNQADGILICILSACAHGHVPEPIADAVFTAARLVHDAKALVRGA